MNGLSIALNVFGALIGSVAACVYGVRIWQKKEQANLATWFIIFILDFIGLYLAYATGNDEAYLQIGWCVAATIILAATWYRKGEWVWTKNETFVLLISGLAIIVWVSMEAVVLSLLGYLVAACVSVVPQAKDYIKNPQVARKSAWVWQVSIVALVFSIAAKAVLGKYGVEHTLIYWGVLGLNIFMASLCLRKPTQQ